MLVDVDDAQIDKIFVTRSERVNSSGLLGNQIKWRHGNLFIKLNCLGYEDIAEVLISHFLSYTNLKDDEYVKYFSCLIYEDGRFLGNGCYSEDFIKDNVEVTVSELLDEHLQSHSISYDDLRDFLYPIVGYDVKDYVDKILSVDSITWNEDRHFKNISFLYKNGIYSPAPIFDNGAGCLSDLISYPLNVSLEDNLKGVYAKPFSIHFKDNFENNIPIQVDYNGFFNSLEFTDEKSLRALEVIKYGLKEMEGISWLRC